MIASLQAEIGARLAENREMETQLTRVQEMLKASVGESEVMKNLEEQISQQKELVKARDAKVEELMKSEKVAREIKEGIMKDIEITK